MFIVFLNPCKWEVLLMPCLLFSLIFSLTNPYLNYMFFFVVSQSKQPLSSGTMTGMLVGTPIWHVDNSCCTRWQWKKSSLSILLTSFTTCQKHHWSFTKPMDHLLLNYSLVLIAMATFFTISFGFLFASSVRRWISTQILLE